MKYLMFVATDTEPDSSTEPLPEVSEWFAQIGEHGTWLAGERLRPATEATLVRVRDGELLVTDEAFTESKERIDGFDIVDCASLDAAIKIAAAHPMARRGRIELRAFWPLDSSD